MQFSNIFIATECGITLDQSLKSLYMDLSNNNSVLSFCKKYIVENAEEQKDPYIL